MIKIKIKDKTNGLVSIPTKGTEGAAAYDLYAPKDFIVEVGRSVMPLGFAMEIPYGYEAKIEPRSGISVKGMPGFTSSLTADYRETYDCDVLVGKIDADYRGEVGVILNSFDHFIIKKGTRLAQMTIYKVEDVQFETVDNLSETKRANGGFGSTGCGVDKKAETGFRKFCSIVKSKFKYSK